MSTKPTDIPEALQTELLSVAYRLADLARPIALRHFRRTSMMTENKVTTGFDPVTIADREIEQGMRDLLADLRPDDGVMGEEFENTSGSSGLTWIVDPIDGTRSYISGTPTWGVLIALTDQSGPVLGIIDQPYTGERFVGGFGSSVMHHQGASRSLQSRECSDLSNAILFSTFPEVGTPKERQAFDAVKEQVKLTRYGTDCYAYALVAAGQIDLVIEAGLNSFDIAAPIALIEQSGGIVTDWAGGPAIDGGQVLAAGSEAVHQAALDILKAFMSR
jgi:histidinol phosphatase-like enzyme (inositol monophosphatase family)